MSMSALILKNLVRQRMRSLLTVLGISIGITTVVALGAIVGGIKAAAGEILQAYGSDFLVAQAGASDLSFSIVGEEEWAAVEARPDVERAIGALFHVSRQGSNPFFITVGIRPDDIEFTRVDLREGRTFDETGTHEIMLGERAANELDAALGDELTIDEEVFTVVGIYRSDNLWSNAGAFAPLATMQEIAGRPGYVTALFVSVAEGADPSTVANAIEEEMETLAAVENVEQYSEVDSGIAIMDAVNLAISALAVGIGAIGVMNTMAMSVFERTREIGVLRAVGWSGRRIVRMIVGESLFLCLLAAVAGSLLGVLASRAVVLIPAVRSLLEPTYGIDLFVRALVVAMLVALAGAAYPVFRAIRLTPMEALRHE
jgi:putative ABC transport system permease protein